MSGDRPALPALPTDRLTGESFQPVHPSSQMGCLFLFESNLLNKEARLPHAAFSLLPGDYRYHIAHNTWRRADGTACGSGDTSADVVNDHWPTEMLPSQDITPAKRATPGEPHRQARGKNVRRGIDASSQSPVPSYKTPFLNTSLSKQRESWVHFPACTRSFTLPAAHVPAFPSPPVRPLHTLMDQFPRKELKAQF